MENNLTYDKLVHSFFNESPEENDLEHHGIPGQKWYLRRFQNEDGSLTPAGRDRYGVGGPRDPKEQKKLAKDVRKAYKKGSYTGVSDTEIAIAVGKSVKDSAKKYVDCQINLRNKKLDIRDRALRDDNLKREIAKDALAAALKDCESDEEREAYKKYYTDPEFRWMDDPEWDDYDLPYYKGDKELTRLYKEAKDAEKKYYGEVGDYINKCVGEYGKMPVVNAKYNKQNVEEILTVAAEIPYENAIYYPEMYDKLFKHSIDIEGDHLEHHGILGQKWGQQNGPPYPLGKDDHSAEEKKLNKFTPSGVIARYKERKEAKRKAAEKAVRVQKMKEGKARKAAERKAAEEHEAAKTKAIQSGNAEEVAKFRSELSYQELNDALNRIDLEKRLNERVAAMQPKAEPVNTDTRTRLERAADLLDKYGNMANKVSNSAENFIKLYNTTAKVMNTFTDTDWPTIEKTSLKDKMEAAEKKRKEREAEEHKKWVDNLIKKNDPEEIDRNSDKLTNDELNAAIRRLNYNEQIQNKIKARNAATEETAEAAQETESKKPEHLPGYEERKQKLAVRSEVRKELGKRDNDSNGTAAAIKNRNFSELVSNVMKDREEGKDYDDTNPDFDASNAWERHKTIRFSKRR